MPTVVGGLIWRKCRFYECHLICNLNKYKKKKKKKKKKNNVTNNNAQIFIEVQFITKNEGEEEEVKEKKKKKKKNINVTGTSIARHVCNVKKTDSLTDSNYSLI